MSPPGSRLMKPRQEVLWFKIGNIRYGVAARSICRTCGKPIILGNRLDVWVHSDRIEKGTLFNHAARPGAVTKAREARPNRSGQAHPAGA